MIIAHLNYFIGADAVDDYMAMHDDPDNFEVIAQRLYCQESDMNEWDSEEDFACHIVKECYDLERTMGNLANYFDYERYGRELFLWDYSMGEHGNVFRRM